MTNSLSPCPSSAMPARIEFRAPGVRPITLSPADIAELHTDGVTVELFGITYTRAVSA